MKMWLLFLCGLVTMTGSPTLQSPASRPTLKKVAWFDLP